MKAVVPILCGLCWLPVSEQVINFDDAPISFLTSDAAMERWQYGPAVGAVLLLSTLAAAQYGFLPLRPALLVDKLESRLNMLQSLLPGRQRRRRGRREVGGGPAAAEMRPELLGAVLRAAVLLGEAIQQYGAARSAT